MKLVVIGVAAVAVLGFGGAYIASQGKNESTAQPVSSAPAKLTFATIQQDVANGGQLVDVRTVEEFTTSHIDGAVNVTLQDIEQGKMPEISKDKPLYVYCRSGNRSGQATVILKNAGYQNVVDLGAMTSVESLGGTIKS